MTPFYFYTKLNQTILLGRKAGDLKELLQGIKAVPGASIYHHTHRFLHQHQYLSPEPPNDFAYWINNILNENLLGEQMSSIDIVRFNSIEEIRKKFIEVIETYLQTTNRGATCPEGGEFHFMSAKSFVIKTPYVANDLTEFKKILEKISINSLYFHIFDSLLRLKKEENDFSNWFRGLKKNELANRVSCLDPYTFTLEGLRKKIINLVERYAKD